MTTGTKAISDKHGCDTYLHVKREYGGSYRLLVATKQPVGIELGHKPCGIPVQLPPVVVGTYRTLGEARRARSATIVELHRHGNHAAWSRARQG